MTKPFGEGALCPDVDSGENDDDYQGPEERPKADPEFLARAELAAHLGDMVDVQRVEVQRMKHGPPEFGWMLVFALTQPAYDRWDPDLFRPLAIMHRDEREALVVHTVHTIRVDRAGVRIIFCDSDIVRSSSLPMPVGVTELHIGGYVVRYEGARRLRRGECISAP